MVHRSHLGDMLTSLAPQLPPPLRGFWARAASRRGLHVAALRAAPEDPWVLANLGMFRSAAESGGGIVPKALGLAGLGKVEEARRLLHSRRVPRRQRSQFARIIAPFDPQASLELLPREALAPRAACLLALGALDQAEDIVAALDDTRETRLLRAACLTRRGANLRARIELNAIFVRDGLEAPFVESDQPLSLADLNLSPPPLMDASAPLVSVVIAARNASDTLGMALDSLRRQTWTNVEILVVDDSSSDRTTDVISGQVRSDERIVPLRNRGIAGAYGARNTGIAAARGAYVTFHDADDWAHPRRIERQVAALETRGAGCVCSHIRLNGEGHILAPRVFPLARINPILLMVRRDALSRWGGFDPVRLGGDSELLARMDALFGRRSIARIPQILVIAGWSGASLMGAANTGLRGEGAQLRVDYVETWRRRHAKGSFSSDIDEAPSLAFADKTWR